MAWEECLAGFWAPVSRAIAEAAIGDVNVYQTPYNYKHQAGYWRGVECRTVWCRVERPILRERLIRWEGVRRIRFWVEGEAEVQGVLERGFG